MANKLPELLQGVAGVIGNVKEGLAGLQEVQPFEGILGAVGTLRDGFLGLLDVQPLQGMVGAVSNLIPGLTELQGVQQQLNQVAVDGATGQLTLNEQLLQSAAGLGAFLTEDSAARLAGEVANFALLGEMDIASLAQKLAALTEHKASVQAVEDESSAAALEKEKGFHEARAAGAEQSDAQIAASQRASAEEGLQAAAQAINVVRGLTEAAKNAELSAIDEEAAKKRALVESTITDEGEKQKALAAIDKEAENKKKKSARKFFEVEKATNIAAALVNTGLAVIKALGSAPPPFNIILAIAAGIAGAVQVDKIRSKPAPSFHAGIPFIPQNLLAQLERGERVVPAGLNIPGVSNIDFANAAFRGLSTAGLGSAQSTSNDNRSFSESVDRSHRIINITGFTDLREALNDLERREGFTVFQR